MLVLTRKSEQKIMIGKDIVITVLKVQGEQVSIGIDAPRAMQILREEIFWEIQKENVDGQAQSRDTVQLGSLAKSLNIKNEKGNKQRQPHLRD